MKADCDICSYSKSICNGQTLLIVWRCRFGWMQHERSKQALHKESEATTQLAQQDPDTLRRLLIDVSYSNCSFF